MTIDEATYFVESMMYLYRPTGEQHDKWCKLLNLLRWYRDQDLIKREDIKKIKPCEYCQEFNGYKSPCIKFYNCKLKAIARAINKIPKAEYRGDK